MFEKYLVTNEPQGLASPGPVIDSITRKMTAALRKAWVPRKSTSHERQECTCGARTMRADLKLMGKRFHTDYLAVHRLAFHRGEVKSVDLKRIEKFNYGEEEPELHELLPPPDSEAAVLAPRPRKPAPGNSELL